MKRTTASRKREGQSPKRRRDDKNKGKKKMDLQDSPNKEEDTSSIDPPQQTASNSEHELQWTPELIWTSPPKPLPPLDDHPLLKNLPTTSQSQPPATYQLPYIPLVFPVIPPPTLYMEPLSPTSVEHSPELPEPVQEVEERKSREDPKTPSSSSPPISPDSSYPSSGPAARPQSPRHRRHSKSEGSCRGHTSTTGSIEKPRCTLHYFRRVRNAQEEGFHVIEGQVWHGESPVESDEATADRRWRRHQWVVDR
jgi:hypothetical protein